VLSQPTLQSHQRVAHGRILGQDGGCFGDLFGTNLARDILSIQPHPHIA
jgi:hypothetical protein